MLLTSSPPLRLPAAESFRWWPAFVAHQRPNFAVSLTSVNGSPAPTYRESNSIRLSQSLSSPMFVNVVFQRDRELGFASILFVISMVLASFFSMVVISLPALHAFRKLAASMNRLSKVTSEEVPGTLSSFKLSDLEINDLTRHLNNLRQRISGNPCVKKGRRSNPGSHGKEN